MEGSPFCFHGGSLAVRFLLYLPTPRSPFAYSRSPTDFNTNTILIHHPAATSLQHSYLQASHLATSPLSPTFPTLPLHLSPPPVPPCHFTPLFPTFPTWPPHLSPPPFPPCYLNSLPDLSHLATSPLSPPFPPCHPSTFPNLPPPHTPTFPTLSPHCPPTFPTFTAHYPPTFSARYHSARRFNRSNQHHQK